MSKRLPFHSINEPDKPKENRVYHNDDACPAGREIPSGERVSGKLSYRLCKLCARLG